MAKIYRLQVTPELFQNARSSDDPIDTEYVFFDSDEEKTAFLDDPEGFVRKIGLYTPLMPFNGLTFGRPSLSLQTYRDDLRRLVFLRHSEGCQLHLPCILCPP